MQNFLCNSYNISGEQVLQNAPFILLTRPPKILYKIWSIGHFAGPPVRVHVSTEIAMTDSPTKSALLLLWGTMSAGDKESVAAIINRDMAKRKQRGGSDGESVAKRAARDATVCDKLSDKIPERANESVAATINRDTAKRKQRDGSDGEPAAKRVTRDTTVCDKISDKIPEMGKVRVLMPEELRGVAARASAYVAPFLGQDTLNFAVGFDIGMSTPTPFRLVDVASSVQLVDVRLSHISRETCRLEGTSDPKINGKNLSEREAYFAFGGAVDDSLTGVLDKVEMEIAGALQRCVRTLRNQKFLEERFSKLSDEMPVKTVAAKYVRSFTIDPSQEERFSKKLLDEMPVKTVAAKYVRSFTIDPSQGDEDSAGNIVLRSTPVEWSGVRAMVVCHDGRERTVASAIRYYDVMLDPGDVEAARALQTLVREVGSKPKRCIIRFNDGLVMTNDQAVTPMRVEEVALDASRIPSPSDVRELLRSACRDTETDEMDVDVSTALTTKFDVANRWIPPVETGSDGISLTAAAIASAADDAGEDKWVFGVQRTVDNARRCIQWLEDEVGSTGCNCVRLASVPPTRLATLMGCGEEGALAFCSSLTGVPGAVLAGGAALALATGRREHLETCGDIDVFLLDTPGETQYAARADQILSAVRDSTVAHSEAAAAGQGTAAATSPGWDVCALGNSVLSARVPGWRLPLQLVCSTATSPSELVRGFDAGYIQCFCFFGAATGGSIDVWGTLACAEALITGVTRVVPDIRADRVTKLSTKGFGAEVTSINGVKDVRTLPTHEERVFRASPRKWPKTKPKPGLLPKPRYENGTLRWNEDGSGTVTVNRGKDSVSVPLHEWTAGVLCKGIQRVRQSREYC